MYLAMLDNEKRHLFLELEIYMSKIDSDFSVEERRIIDTHCMEMRIDNNDYECELPMELVLSRINKECDDREKRIIFLELAATVLADNVYHETEKELIEKLAQVCALPSGKPAEVIGLIKRLKAVYEDCASFVGEG